MTKIADLMPADLDLLSSAWNTPRPGAGDRRRVRAELLDVDPELQVRLDDIRASYAARVEEVVGELRAEGVSPRECERLRHVQWDGAMDQLLDLERIRTARSLELEDVASGLEGP